MIDHLVGRPNPSWKRTQVFLVIIFWLWRIIRGNSGPPRILWLPRLNRALQRFTPWQIILSTLTTLYAIRNFDKILGLNAPEPLARLYSPSYYRATWIATGLDAGFATAMSIRPKWLRDIASLVFSVYYILYAQEADEKLRRYRAVPTVEMLRVTWEKTTNPYIRLISHLPRMNIRRKILLPRPSSSTYTRPMTVYLFFAGSESELAKATELVLDFPGGGFVAMTPEHHEERLRIWAKTTRRPVLSIDYGKAPEYPYPFARDESFDCYRLMVESRGKLIGMSGRKISIILSGDSAGGCLAVNVTLRILELRNGLEPVHLPLPTAVVLNYAALDFNFTSWMSNENLRILKSEQQTSTTEGDLLALREVVAGKDHLRHVSPLSMVRDKKHSRKRMKRRSSWKDSLRGWMSAGDDEAPKMEKPQRYISSAPGAKSASSVTLAVPDEGSLADAESEDDEADFGTVSEADKPIKARILFKYPGHSEGYSSMPKRTYSALEREQVELSMAVKEADSQAVKNIGHGDAARKEVKESDEKLGTRLTMTSRTGYFQDRIVAPSMMRAMAILYIGPHRNPDFGTDYHISPLLAPSHLLAQFPPLLLQCGEKDPFVDDTVLFAGKVREAKRARKSELDLLLSGKSARFGESLRMTTAKGEGGHDMYELRRERNKLGRETEVDWVQMVLFPDWSHGFLQMPTLMHEAKVVIEELGEWINHAFSKYGKVIIESSPLNSETEGEDVGITFIGKGRGSNGSDKTVVESSVVGGVGVQVSVQSISESELIRRRRLLDSHIFE